MVDGTIKRKRDEETKVDESESTAQRSKRLKTNEEEETKMDIEGEEETKMDIEGDVDCKNVLYNYSDEYLKWDFYVNGYLREGNSFFDKNTSWEGWFGKDKTKDEAIAMIKKAITDMDKCFQKYSYPRNEELIVYRGMKNTFYKNDDGSDMKIGDTIKMNMYTSTSTNLLIAEKYADRGQCCLYEFHVDKDTPFINMDCCSKFQGEDSEFEILLPRGIYLTYAGIKSDYILKPQKHHRTSEDDKKLLIESMSNTDRESREQQELELIKIQDEINQSRSNVFRIYNVSMKHP